MNTNFFNGKSSDRLAAFWAKYRTFLAEKVIPAERIKWYEHWAVEFAKAIKGVPLRARTPADIESFLQSLRGQPNLQPWQIIQAEEAVRFLLDDFLHTSNKRGPGGRS